ncbi:MAG: S24 family peptidase [Duncaniella sp.]|nr:S24 family peptidase [Duncaniella sp.]
MAKTLTIKEKILAFLKEQGIKKVDFFEKTGIQSSNFKGANLTSAPGSEMLVKILTIYPELSAEWLMTGNGEMLKTNRLTKSNPHVLPGKSDPINNGKVTEFTPITQEKEHNIILETRPRIPLEAAAGMLSVATESVTKEQCEQVPVIAAMPNYDFTIMVKGDSMEPDFKSGDEVACRFVRESSFIQWGQPHVIDSYDGIVLKRIHDNGDRIICSSDNPSYGNFQIPKNEINRLALVVGLIRLY